MKLNNALIVLENIRKHAPVSRADLAKELGLTSASLTNIVSTLLEKNLLLETGVADSAKGRRPIQLDINPDACYVIGVSFTTDDSRIVLFDFKLQPVMSKALDIDSYTDAERLCERIEEGVRYLLDYHNIGTDKILGIGVSAPGPLDSKKGVLINPPNFPNLRNMHICALLEERLNIPICCDRETNAAALAEVKHGVAAGYKTMFYLMLFRNSVGGSFVSNGNVIHGFRDGAGEIGHMLIDINGPRCTCGHFGCLEALIKGDAIVNEARTHIKTMDNLNLPVPCNVEELTLGDVFRMGVLEIPLFADIVDRAARTVAVAIGNVVTLFSPELIVLGGAKETMDDQFLKKIQEYSSNRKYPLHAREVKIRPTKFGDMACAYGAGSLVLEEFQWRLCEEESIL